MDSKEAISKYKKLLSNNNKYSLTGEMEIFSNEEKYHYNVTVDYKQGDYYKATLNNKDTDSTQIILKNDTGVYVITPSLNKSFKFQSEWPYNSSQSYILESLLKDMENDSNVLIENTDDEIEISSTVNYPNNSSLISQKITFNKDMIPTKVEVYDKEGVASIIFKISKIDFKPKFDKNHFDIDNTSETISDEVTEESENTSSDDLTEESETISDEVTEESETTSSEESKDVSSIDEILYPMYLPSGTSFKGEETVKNGESERVILTFTGDKPFTLIEEKSKATKDFEVTSTSGELVFYENILGSLTDTSLNWTMNDKDYYLIGDNLTNEELLKVAASTSVVALSK